MWHTLADTVVDGDEGPFGLQALFHGMSKQLGVLEEWCDEGGGQIDERFVI